MDELVEVTPVTTKGRRSSVKPKIYVKFPKYTNNQLGPMLGPFDCVDMKPDDSGRFYLEAKNNKKNPVIIARYKPDDNLWYLDDIFEVDGYINFSFVCSNL